MPWLWRGIIWSLGLYGLAVLGLCTFQRHIFFQTRDGGALAASGWNAIKNSQRFKLQTSDGERLLAWYVAPRGDLPVFLFLGGRSGRLDVKKWRWARITKRGYGVLAFSYRGYPGSTGSPSEVGLIKDAEAAYRWLNTRIETDQIVIHGQSLGSGVAVAIAARVAARALILETPFTAAVDLAAETYPLFPVRLLMKDKFLSRQRIQAVTMPLLIVHGTKDSVIPFSHGRQLFRLAPEPKTFVTMEGSDHSTLTRDGMYPHIWKFLEQNGKSD